MGPEQNHHMPAGGGYARTVVLLTPRYCIFSKYGLIDFIIISQDSC